MPSLAEVLEQLPPDRIINVELKYAAGAGRGLAVSAWGDRNLAELQAVLHQDVDGVITDRPSEALRLISARPWTLDRSSGVVARRPVANTQQGGRRLSHATAGRHRSLLGLDARLVTLVGYLAHLLISRGNPWRCLPG